MKFPAAALAVLSVSTLATVTTAATVSMLPNDNNFELLILHNNDMHARFEQTSKLSATCSKSDIENDKCYGGFARVAHEVRKARNLASKGESPPVLYLNAGDTYTGTVWFAVYKWEIAAAFINALHPDAVSLGNHEFDEGVSGLTPFIENLTSPVLCANIDVDKEPELSKEKNLKRSIILNVNGTNVGIIGYLTPDTKFLVSPNRVEYEDEVVAIKREVKTLQGQGINILIALGHSGFETDRKIAKEVNGIDLVIGGHTNTFLWNGENPDLEEKQGPYPTIITQKSGKKVPVVQAYAYTKYLGRLHLIFDSEGNLIEHDGLPLLLNSSIPQESDVLELLEKFRPGINNISMHVVGKTRVLLDGNSISCRLVECNLGNLITDAMIYAYSLDQSIENGWTDAPIAIQQGGGIRSSIDSLDADGNITRSDIMNSLPFANAIIAVNITGAVLNKVLEWSVYNYDPVEMPGAFLQYSGIKVKYDISKPAGSRVVSASARCGLCNIPKYSSIVDNDYYNILISQFLFVGGDGYFMLRDNVTSSKILNYDDVDTVVKYIERKTPIYPEVGGRIVILNGAMTVTFSGALILSMALLLNII